MDTLFLDEVEVRYLPSTAKRADRVKLAYINRGKTLTMHFEGTKVENPDHEAIEFLNQHEVPVEFAISRDGSRPTSLGIKAEHRKQLCKLFKIKR
jgi:hypothetical protein